MNQLTLITDGFPESRGMDVAVSHAILNAVSDGEMGGVLRIHRPGAIVAFGRADRVTPGYAQAVRAAHAHGFDAVERLAGGRAAVFHEETIAFSWAIPEQDPKTGIKKRFEAISSLIAGTLQGFGLDARVGAIPGEYCPGDYSVNVAGVYKVMGVGQRLVKNAAHVGGVIVVDGGWRIRDVLIPVYRSLGLDWDPRTAGAAADRAPGTDVQAVAQAMIDAFSEQFELVRAPIPEDIITRAAGLTNQHLADVA